MGFALKYKWRKKVNWQVWVADIISGTLLVLFLYTAVSKILDYENFKVALQDSLWLKPISSILSWTLPAIEIILALILFFPSTRIKGLYASICLLALFISYLLNVITFSPHLPCNCGGVLTFLTWKDHIYFNLFFIALSITGIILYKRYRNRPNKSPP